MNDTILNIIEIVLSLLLVGLILLQTKGTGLGNTFGGDISFYGTKRGAERILFIATIVTAFLFLVTSLVSVMF